MDLDYELVTREFQPLIDAAHRYVEEQFDAWDRQRAEGYNKNLIPEFGEEDEDDEE